MPRSCRVASGALALAAMLSLVAAATASDLAPTKMLRSPTVSATQIAFAYAQNIWIVDRAGGPARRLSSFQGEAANPRFSPDGKWVAYSSTDSGSRHVYIEQVDAPGRAWQVSVKNGREPQWGPDGKEIFYLEEGGRIMAVPVRLGDQSPDLGLPQMLFRTAGPIRSPRR